MFGPGILIFYFIKAITTNLAAQHIKRHVHSSAGFTLGKAFFVITGFFTDFQIICPFFLRFIPHHSHSLMSRRPVRASLPLCLVMSVRQACPPTRVHWGLPSCLSPAARRQQWPPQSQLLQARWVTDDVENLHVIIWSSVQHQMHKRSAFPSCLSF